MLVLLVIFIITAPLMASSIKLDLPRTDAGQPNETPKFVTLVVDASGQGLPERPAGDDATNWPPDSRRPPPTAAIPKSSFAPIRPCPTARSSS